MAAAAAAARARQTAVTPKAAEQAGKAEKTAAKPQAVKPAATAVKPHAAAGKATASAAAPTATAAAMSAAGSAAGFRMWKDGTRRGIVYVEGKENAERAIVATGWTPRAAPAPPTPKKLREKGDADALLDGAMAVYCDRRGRPFAWQIPFDIGRWEQVTAAMSGGAS